MTKKAIEPAKTELSEYKLPIDNAAISEIILNNVGSDGITVNKLDRFMNPSTTGTTWSIPSLIGEDETVSEIEGVIVFHKLSRARWEGEYKGGGDAPLCSSKNGFDGEGDPGGKCNECPYAKFTEDDKGESVKPECRLVKQVFVRTPGSLFPKVLNVSAININQIDRYLFRLADKLHSYNHVVTRVTVETDTSKSGYKYPRFIFEGVAFVPEDQKEESTKYTKLITPMLLEVEMTEDDVVTSGEPDW